MKKINFDDLIVYECDHYFVINKPPFVATLADRNDKINISQLAKTYWKDAQVCHRLDKETSVALAIAKNPEAYRHLAMLFEKRKVHKEYHAVVDGVHSFSNTENYSRLLTMSNGIVRTHPKGKQALTIFDTLRQYKKHTLVSCKPLEGRMHQIRAHLQAINAPITGDTQYGGKIFYLSQIKNKYKSKKNAEEAPLIKRVALHANTLMFDDMIGQNIKILAKYPKDMKVLIRQLENN